MDAVSADMLHVLSVAFRLGSPSTAPDDGHPPRKAPQLRLFAGWQRGKTLRGFPYRAGGIQLIMERQHQ